MSKCLDDLELVGTTGIAGLLGISRHALAMRMGRTTDIPPPDRRLGGCIIWFATPELAKALGVSLADLRDAAGQ